MRTLNLENPSLENLIEFYEDIPEEQWGVEELTTNDGKHCALGHFMVAADLEEFNDDIESEFDILFSKNITGIQLLSPVVIYANDRVKNQCTEDYDIFDLKSPKERVLKVLNDIKNKNKN